MADPGLDARLGPNLSGQKRLLVATSAFRNEPYAAASTTP